MLKYSQKVIYWNDLKKMKSEKKKKKGNEHAVSNSRGERVLVRNYLRKQM